MTLLRVEQDKGKRKETFETKQNKKEESKCPEEPSWVGGKYGKNKDP